MISKRYLTQKGFTRLQTELSLLLTQERPEIVQMISWAASNGDRSENGDYLYGKKRLREIDRRIRFLTKTLENAEIVDPSIHVGKSQIFFGARVTYEMENRQMFTIKIVGEEEADPSSLHISWRSPLAQTLLKHHEGDDVVLRTPDGEQTITIVGVDYNS